MSIFWGHGIGSNQQAYAAQADASSAQTEARAAARTIVSLERRLDRALLASEAMWTFVRDKLGVTDEQLIERMNDIDLSDGKLDGKVRREPGTCPKCDRKISAHLPKCMYCGAPVTPEPFI